MRIAPLCLLAGLLILAVSAVDTAGAQAPAIKKCRDSAGRWHYGDTAAAACTDSKVIVIDEHGITRGEISPPPSEAELRAREAERDKLEQARERARRDELLLTTYSHEADIIYVRDRRLAQIESMIKASTDTLKPLQATLEHLEKQAVEEQSREGGTSEHTEKALEQTRAQIEKHEAAIVRRRQEQEAVRTQAQADLERYRELKSDASPAPAAAKP